MDSPELALWKAVVKQGVHDAIWGTATELNQAWWWIMKSHGFFNSFDVISSFTDCNIYQTKVTIATEAPIFQAKMLQKLGDEINELFKNRHKNSTNRYRHHRLNALMTEYRAIKSWFRTYDPFIKKYGGTNVQGLNRRSRQ